MHAYDIIGYAVDASLVCADCATSKERKQCSPVFADSETDCPSHCDRCHCLIEENLTADGMAYVAESALECALHGQGNPEVVQSWLSVWPDSLESLEPSELADCLTLLLTMRANHARKQIGQFDLPFPDTNPQPR